MGGIGFGCGALRYVWRFSLGSDDDFEPEGDMESWFISGKVSWADFYAFILEQGMYVTYDQALTAYQRGEISKETFNRFTQQGGTKTIQSSAGQGGMSSVTATVNNPNPADRLNLRAKPSTTSTSLGKYYSGTVVDILANEGAWC